MTGLGRWARDLLEASLVALLLGLFARTFVAQVYRVPSSSMEPLLEAGDYLLVNKLIVRDRAARWPNRWLPQREIARGDVLVLPHPQRTGELLVKRCVAGSGDHVFIRDKVLFINRERVDEDYAVFRDPRVYPASSFLPEEIRVRDQFGPVVISEGELFCLGDNRDQSSDSRHWSSIEGRRVVGQATIGFRSPFKPDPSKRVLPRQNQQEVGSTAAPSAANGPHRQSSTADHEAGAQASRTAGDRRSDRHLFRVR